MASKNVEDWEEPLSSEPSMGDEEEDTENYERFLKRANMERLQRYVNNMAYRPTPSPRVTSRLNKLAEPRKVILLDTYDTFRNVLEPKQRSRRMKRMAGQYSALTAEQFESIIRAQKLKERKKEELLRRKQDIFCELLQKLEQQCRSQYLNVLIKKFANFISKLATTMRIPPELVEPYSRMQRGIFCNIMLAIGIQPADPATMYYNNPQAQEYEVCHKLAHALLSLIIKALDTAATQNPEDIVVPEYDNTMDNYIKDRLMCAAEKKVLNSRKLRKGASKPEALRDSFVACKCDGKHW